MFKLNQHVFSKSGKEVVIVGIVTLDTIDISENYVKYQGVNVDLFTSGCTSPSTFFKEHNYFPSMDALRKHLVSIALEVEAN